MRGINVTAVRAPLMLALFGTGLVALVVLGFAIAGTLGGATWWAVAASVVYLVGAIGVTGGANVPRNNRLAAAPEEAGALASAWTAFRPGWQAWNHVRTHHVRGGMRRLRGGAGRRLSSASARRAGDRRQRRFFVATAAVTWCAVSAKALPIAEANARCSSLSGTSSLTAAPASVAASAAASDDVNGMSQSSSVSSGVRSSL